MFDEINNHHLISTYRNSAAAWEQQTEQQWRQAAEEFQYLRSRHGDLRELIAAHAYCLGQAARKQELYEQAAKYFSEVGDLLPDWPLAPEALAAVYRRLGRRQEAESLLNRALKLEGGLIQARLLYAELLCERNNYKAAEDVLKMGLKSHPSEVGFYCFLGNIALSDRRLESAERHYQRALTLNPDCSCAYAGLSSVRMLEDRFNDALDLVKKAIQLNNRATAAFINRAIIHYTFNNRAEAEADFDRAIRIAPRDAQNLFRIATFYWKKEDIKNAERYLRLAINCESYRSEYHTALALLYLEANRLEEAEQHYHQALLLNPEDILALHGLGALALTRGDAKIADNYLARATTLLFASRRYLTGKLAERLNPKLRASI